MPIVITVVSRTIIDHHEGRIGVSSKLGVGSTFYFELKLHPCSLNSQDLPQDIEQGFMNVMLDSSQASRGGITPPIQMASTHIPSSNNFLCHQFDRVLVVDDSKLNRKMLCRQLKNHFKDIVEVRYLVSCVLFYLF